MESTGGLAGPDVPGLLPIGRIAGLHGLRGALRLRLYNPDGGSLRVLKRLFIETGGEVREYVLGDAAQAGKHHFKIVLAGIAERTQAEMLKGAPVYAAQSDLPAPAPGEFYYFQAVGCEVRLSDGRRLGAIADVFQTGANDIWIVRGNGKEYLIPVIEDVVLRTDFEAKQITIEPIAGLLD